MEFIQIRNHIIDVDRIIAVKYTEKSLVIKLDAGNPPINYSIGDLSEVEKLQAIEKIKLLSIDDFNYPED